MFEKNMHKFIIKYYTCKVIKIFESEALAHPVYIYIFKISGMAHVY